MSDFNNIATFRLADASKIDNLPADTNSELAGKAAASHTHDDRYYTETEVNSFLSGKQSVSEKGQPSGYASLDGTGKVPASQLPATVVDGDMSKSTYDTNDNGIVDNSEKLGGQLPSYYLDVDNHTDGTTNKVYTTTEKTKLSGIEAGAEVNEVNEAPIDGKQYARKDGDWEEVISGGGGGAVDSVNGQTGVVVLDTDDIAEGTTNKYLSATDKADLTDGGDTELHTHDGRYYTETETNNLLNDKANYNEVVKLTGNQTIAGVKTFSNNPVVSTGIEIGHASDTTITRVGAGRIAVEGIELVRNGDTPILTSINISNIDTTISRVSAGVIAVEGKTVATTDGTVNLTGNQTIAGVKTFSSSPIVPTPTADMEVATKKYVDDNAGGGSSTQSTFVAGENITAGNALRNGRGNTLSITSINNLTSATDTQAVGTRIGYSTSEQYIGQSFTLTGLENYLNSISVKLGKSGSPTGNLTMKIYSNTGTTLIATSSNTISESSIVVGNTYTFNFADYIPTGIPLYIRIETSRANSTSSYSWIYYSTASSITGDFYQISSTNSWSVLSTYDMGISINTSIIEDTTQLYKTNALLSTTSNFYGFATNAVSTGGNVILDTSGVSNTQSGLTIGSYYYLSNTAGAISTTPGTNIVSVGKAVSTTGIEINNNFVNNDTIIISLQQNFATTTVINHNLGRIPEKIEFQHISAVSNGQHSKGIYKNGTNKCIYYYSGTSPYAYSDNTKCCKDGYGFTAYVSAVTSTTFTLVNTANSGSSSYLQIIATLS